MKEAGIVRPEQRAEDRVLLVARARDRVVAAVGLLELARGDVDGAACHLVLEQVHRLARGQRGAARYGLVAGKSVGRGPRIPQVVVEASLDDLDAGQRSNSCSLASMSFLVWL